MVSTRLELASIMYILDYGYIRNVLLVALIVALILILANLYKIRRSIRALVQGAKEIAAGNLDHRVDIRTGDELEDLANTLNRMAESLQHTRSQLREEHTRLLRTAREAGTLYRVSQTLVSTLDLRDRLAIIAGNLADVCKTKKAVIWLVEGNLLIPCAFHGLTEEEEEIFSRWQVHVEESTRATQEALRERSPVMIHDALHDPRIPRDIAERLSIRSALALPFVFEDEPIGYAVTYDTERTHRFTKYQLNLAQAIAAQAAVAISQSRVYERERRISETLQRALLPDVPPSVGDFEIADKYTPTRAEAEVGGDLYDVIQLSPTRVALTIADVSGKGLSAATHTALVKYTLRAYALDETEPSRVIDKVNNALYKYIETQAFITLFYGVLDIETKDFTYVNAGHELPLLYGEERRICMQLATTGMALGIVPDYRYEQEVVDFVPGDVLLLYTDGATEARRDRQFLGIEGLEEVFCAVAHGDAHSVVDRLNDRLLEFSRGRLHDDVALLVVKYRRTVTAE